MSRQIDMLVDTGASKNFINDTIATELGLIGRETTSIEILKAYKGSLKLDRIVGTKIKLTGIRKEFYVDFYVLENCVEEVILGNEFIFNNKAILDFERNVLKMNNEEVKILKENVEKDDLDKYFFEKLSLMTGEIGSEMNVKKTI